jgi:hypothetical protein
MPRLTRQETIVLLAVAGLLLLGLGAKFWRLNRQHAPAEQSQKR